MAGDNATITLKGENKQLKQVLSKSEGAVKKFGTSVKKVFVAIAAVVAAKVIFSAFEKFIKLAGEQEKVEARLEGVLRATGNAAGFTAEEIKKQAAALQLLTTFGDETILSAQAILLTFKNIKGDQFKEATAAMLDMAAVMDTDAKSGAVQLGKALNDPIKGIAALSRVGVGFTKEQIKLIKGFQESGQIAKAQGVILDELKGQFGGVAQKMAETSSGQLAQFKNRMGDLGETIGAKLAPVLLKLLPTLEKVANFFVDRVVPGIEATVEIIQFVVARIKEELAPAFEVFVDNVVQAFTVFQTAIVDWKDALTLAFKGVQLAFVKSFNVIVHFLTVVIPEAAKFFADNFLEILRDIAVGAKTIFDNIAKNALEAIDPRNLLPGGKFEFVGLTEGFESTIGEFPEIAARVKGELEKELELDIGRLGAGLADRFNKRLAANRKSLDDFLKGGEEAVEKKPSVVEFVRPSGTEEVKEKGKFEVAPEVKTREDFKASIEGLTALNQRITTAAASVRKEDDPAVKALKALKEAGKVFSKEELKKLERLIDGVTAQDQTARANNKLIERWLAAQGLR